MEDNATPGDRFSWQDGEIEIGAPQSGPPKLLDVPDVRQQEIGSCGAAALRTVSEFYGIGPETEAEYRQMLDTSNAEGTAVDNLVRVAGELGLKVRAGAMSVEELRSTVAGGTPVICPVQIEGTGDKEGHYVVVIGVTAKSVFVQDPVRGRWRVGIKLWMERWHDTDADGQKYNSYGIALGPPDEVTS